jgi:hypothetical protein
MGIFLNLIISCISLTITLQSVIPHPPYSRHLLTGRGEVELAIFRRAVTCYFSWTDDAFQNLGHSLCNTSLTAQDWDSSNPSVISLA